MNMKAHRQRNAQRYAYARTDRMLAKVHRRSNAHRLEHKNKTAKKPKKKLHERSLLIGTLAGVFADRLVALGGYCKQELSNIDLAPLVRTLAFGVDKAGDIATTLLSFIS